MKIIAIFIIVYITNLNHTYSQTYNSIKELNTETGLPSDVVYNVIQDKNGYIWIATENGVVKYNGTSYKIFQKKDGLPNNDIFKINVDSKNRIWLTGFHKGLYYIENDVVKKINKTEKISGLSYSFEKDKKIFFNVFFNYKSYVLNNNLLYEFRLGGSNKNVLDYCSKEKVFIGYDDKTDQFFYSNGNKEYSIPLHYFYSKNLQLDGPSFVFDNSNKRLYSPERKTDNKTIFISNNTINTNKQSSKNLIILNKEDDFKYNIFKDKDSITIYKNGKYEKPLTNKLNKIKFLHNEINFILIDNQENFWIVNKNQNLFFIPNNFDAITSFILKKGITSKNGHLHKNNYYILSTDNILYKLDLKNNFLQKIKEYKNLNPRKIILKNDTIIISCTEGIDYPFKEKVFYPMVNRKSVIQNNNIYHINLSRIYKDKKIIYENKNAIRYNNILISNKNKILVSNEDEITLLNGKKTIINSKLKNTNCLGKLNEIFIVGTNSNGLYLLDGDLKIHYKTLDNEIINTIEADTKSGEIFVSSSRGLDIFKIINFKLVPIKSLNTKDGFISGKTNNIQFDEKYIYLSTSNGVSQLDRNKILLYKKFGKIDLENILINGVQEKEKSDRNIFERDENNISFKTSIFTFQNPNNFKKYYSFSHNDTVTKWKLFNEKNLAFRELQPGNYNVKFKLVSNDQNILLDNKAINFKVKYYFWETLLFKISIIILILSIVFLVYLYYQKKTTKKYKLKLKLYNLELKALRAQMNPHFIFNSLNNFQSLYILEGERSANNFLSKFSFFIRKTLEISNKDNVTLNEEIEFIKSYIEVESLKNNININFQLKADDNLQMNNITIPVMILQPIVENSILHGLLPSKNKKEIKMNIAKLNNSIQITIEDNGVGINYKKKDELKDHKSYATKIIKDRIKILNSLYKKESYKISIEDLNKTCSSKSGTKVTLTIPMLGNEYY